jgi:hypothetical protein
MNPSSPSVQSVVKASEYPAVVFHPGTFFLVLEFGQTVAALLPDRLNTTQFRTLFAILPPRASNSPVLAARWEMACVICTPEWESAQLKRIPLTRPKTVAALTFL